MRHDYLEPELAHPGQEMGGIPEDMSFGMAKAATLRDIAKQVFMSVVKESVELVAMEAASKALREEINDQQRTGVSSMASNGGRSRDRVRNSPIPPPASRPPLPSEDSAAGASAFDTFSPRRLSSGRRIGGQLSMSAFGSSERHGGPGSSSDMSRGGRSSESVSASRRTAISTGGRGAEAVIERGAYASGVGVPRRGQEMDLSFRDTGTGMEDQEREMLLSLLTGAYDQVNELTDELKLSLQKLHETEKELKELARSSSSKETLGRSSSTRDLRSIQELESLEAELESDAEPKGASSSSRGKKGVGKMIKGLLPQDEGAKSTPATVRQLQAEVQRLRQRVQQANAGEERQRADLARVQRLMAVMETQLEEQNNGAASARPGKMEGGPIRRHHRSQSARNLSIHRGAEPTAWAGAGAVCTTPGGTRYQEGVTKPLVDRVVELEEKLVKSSMENATAKQDYLTMKLRNSQLEKTGQMLRHELAKSEAMNELLQSEVSALETLDKSRADGDAHKKPMTDAPLNNAGRSSIRTMERQAKHHFAGRTKGAMFAVSNAIYRLQGTMSPGEAGDPRGWRRWLGGIQEPLQLSPEPIKVSSGDTDTDSPIVVVRDLDNNQLVYAPGRADFM